MTSNKFVPARERCSVARAEKTSEQFGGVEIGF